jgi:hypothetical protein
VPAIQFAGYDGIPATARRAPAAGSPSAVTVIASWAGSGCRGLKCGH